MYILVLNSGSSSLKVKLFAQKSLKLIYHAHVDGIGMKKCVFNTTIYSNTYLKKLSATVINRQQAQTDIEHAHITNHEDALQLILKHMKQSHVIEDIKLITAIGHRVVHGGDKFTKSTLVTKHVVAAIKKLGKLAPLHNPPDLAGILACQKIIPRTRNIAVFDTTFHKTIPEKAYLYALPYSLSQRYHIRRYGFHGISHQYVAGVAQEYLSSSSLPASRMISCHLGNGCSINAIKNARSIDTSMGFTPLEGLIMGTRCGDLDPGIILYLMKEKGYDEAKINRLLNYESGLKGIFQKSRDMRDIWHEIQSSKIKNPTHKLQATLALDMYTYRIVKYIGAYTAILNGLDCLIFTGGIGENAWYIRRDVVKNLEFLGLKLNNKKNQHLVLHHAFRVPRIISSPQSTAKILVISANEELQIAQETKKMTK